MRTVLVVLGVAFLAMAFACGGGVSTSSTTSTVETSRPAESTEVAAPDVAAETADPAVAPEPVEEEETYKVFSAAQVYTYYDENEIRGDQELKDKWFAVKGQISEINKDIIGTPYIAFHSDNWIFGVQCMFPRSAESALVELVPGNVVTIAGKCSGKLGNVLMRDCRFYVSPEERPPTAAELERQKAEQERRAIEARIQREKAEAAERARNTRVWTSGTFSIEAEFVSYGMGKVKLQKADGSIIEVPAERLSEADREWIQDRMP